MNKVIKKQQAAQPRNGLERLRKQDISDPTASYSVSLTNISLVALSSLHQVYAHWQIQINNNPISRQRLRHDVRLALLADEMRLALAAAGLTQQKILLSKNAHRSDPSNQASRQFGSAIIVPCH
jgi:hypothetical protein